MQHVGARLPRRATDLLGGRRGHFDRVGGQAAEDRAGGGIGEAAEHGPKIADAG
jgi:hypothetical protein